MTWSDGTRFIQEWRQESTLATSKQAFNALCQKFCNMEVSSLKLNTQASLKT